MAEDEQEVKEETILVNLKRTIGVRVPGRGIVYHGPGQGVEVPVWWAKEIGKAEDALTHVVDEGDTSGMPAGSPKPQLGTPDFPTDRESLEKMTKDELQGEVTLRQLQIEGTGANGGVLKDDLIEALVVEE